MSTMKVIRSLKPTRQYVLDLMLKHGDADGRLGLHVLDEKEPDWEQHVPTRMFAIQTSDSLMRTGRFKYEKEKALLAAANGEPVREQPDRRKHKDLSEDKLVLIKMFDRFKDSKGQMDWKRFEREAPEEYQRFSSPDARVRQQKGYQMLNWLRNNGLLNGPVQSNGVPLPMVKRAYHKKHKVKRVVAVVKSPEEQREAEVQARVEQVMSKMGYCPKCGNSLLTLMRAIVFEIKGN